MRQTCRSTLLGLATGLCLAFPRAEACEGAAALADLHAAFTALLSASDSAERRAAVSAASDMLATSDAQSLNRQLNAEGAFSDVSRISQLLADLAILTTDVELGSELTVGAQGRAQYDGALSDLARLAGQTECATTGPDVAQKAARDAAPASATESQGPPIISKTAAWIAGIGLVAAAVAGFVARNRKALRYRFFDSRRRDRRIVDFTVDLFVPGEAAPRLVRVQDISITGMKIATVEGIPAKTPLIIRAYGQSIPAAAVWSNAHFTGLQFGSPLEEEAFDALLNGSKTQKAALEGPPDHLKKAV